MRTEAPFWVPPLLAVQFLTRLPVPPLNGLTEGQVRNALGRSTAWLPLVGGAIGLSTALVFMAARLIWPPLVAAIVAIGIEAWVTGAFHEDAVADFCDAFGGSARDPGEIRRIMKDSRIGSYGAMGLWLSVSLRIATTAALPEALAMAAIVAAATAGRLCAVALLAAVPPVQPGEGTAKTMAGGSRPNMGAASLATLPGVVALAVQRPLALVAGAAMCALLSARLAQTLRRRIGGSTGDCLGFGAYMGQLAVLLAASAR